jgi:hypothetical protein
MMLLLLHFTKLSYNQSNLVFGWLFCLLSFFLFFGLMKPRVLKAVDRLNFQLDFFDPQDKFSNKFMSILFGNIFISKKRRLKLNT